MSTVTSLAVKLPFLVTASDYHEFKYLGEFARKINQSIKIKEIGFDDRGFFVGLVYIGSLPKRAEIDLLWKSHKLVKAQD